MRWHVHLCGCFVLSAAAGVLAQPPDANLPPPPVPEGVTDDADMDVLTRGPVHEAFAEQINRDPSAGIVVPKAPPEPVKEIPPDAKPEGDDVAWISGYWFWDKDRNDFVWVSGVWRRIPPGRRWVPGYWQAESGGYQWVAGFWAAAERSELEYLDAPPASLEVGPASPAPSVDHFWIPGCWISTAGLYSWRPGYWSAYRDDWTWITARYAWTPRGCIYVSGYWDHPWSRRGCLFAPVYFHRPVYLHVGYNYRPAWCIEYNTLLMHLFVSPTYHHYYFGDYYGPECHRDYYYACRAYGGSQSWYDPFCVYYQHLFRRQGVDYLGRVQGWHSYYVRHADHRPAHTCRAQLQQRGVDRLVEQNSIARSWRPSAAGIIRDQRVTPVGSAQLARIRRESEEHVALATQRRRVETAQRDHTDRRLPGESTRRASDRSNKLVLPQRSFIPPLAGHAGADPVASVGEQSLRLGTPSASRSGGHPIQVDRDAAEPRRVARPSHRPSRAFTLGASGATELPDGPPRVPFASDPPRTVLRGQSPGSTRRLPIDFGNPDPSASGGGRALRTPPVTLPNTRLMTPLTSRSGSGSSTSGGDRAWRTPPMTLPNTRLMTPLTSRSGSGSSTSGGDRAWRTPPMTLPNTRLIPPTTGRSDFGRSDFGRSASGRSGRR